MEAITQKSSVADPGFPVWGGGGVHLRCGHLSVKMYAKTKELGPIGGGMRPARPPKSANGVDAEQFTLVIVHGLLDGYQRETPLGHGRPSCDPPGCIIGGDHYIGLNPTIKKNGKRSQPDCVVCSDRKARRHYNVSYHKL